MFSSFQNGFKAFVNELKNGESASKALATQLKGILSPVGLLAAGLTAVGSLVVTCWNKMTLSAEGYAEKLASATRKAEKEREETEKRIQSTKEYLAQLEALSSAENAGKTSMEQAQVLVASLTKKYGDLGISINNVTGKIQGLSNAQEKLSSIQKKELASATKKELNALERQAKKQAEIALTTMMPGESMLNKMGLTYTWMDDIKDKSDNIMSNTPLENRLKYAQNMYDRSSSQEDINAWQRVIDLLENAIKKKKELASIQKSGYKSEEEEINVLLAATQRVIQSQKDLKKLQKENQNAQIDHDFGKLTDTDDKIRNRETRLKDTRKKQLELSSRVMASQLDENRAILTPEQQMKARQETVDLMKQEAVATREVQELENQIKDLKDSRTKQATDLVNSAKFEAEYQALIAQKQYDKAAALKLEYDLKQKNLKLTAEERADLEESLKKQKEISAA